MQLRISDSLCYFNNRAHINYKAGSSVASGGKSHLQDLNSTARETRLVRKFSFKFLEGQCLFSQDTIQDEPSPELATKSHTRDKTGKKLISRDFVASDCRQQLFDHDSCESDVQVRLCLYLQFSTGSNYILKALLFEGVFELDCSQPVYNLRTRKKKRAKRVRSRPGWGFVSEASKRNIIFLLFFSVPTSYPVKSSVLRWRLVLSLY